MILSAKFSMSIRSIITFHNNLSNSHLGSFCSSKSSNAPLVKKRGNTLLWNFNLFDNYSPSFDLLLVLNNPNNNLPWFELATSQAQSIVLVDGGANIFYSLQSFIPKQSISKVNAIIGDLDSVETNVQQFYKHRNVKIIKDPDVGKNDFQKSLIYGIKMGCKSIVVSGAFGDRMDHNFGALSITEKIMNAHQQVNIVMANGSSIYTPLRTGYEHQITISKLINRVGCGLISFQKIYNLETSGFKWNLGQKQLHKQIQWGKFLSTSNEIMKDQITISSKKVENGFINFVAKLKQG